MHWPVSLAKLGGDGQALCLSSEFHSLLTTPACSCSQLNCAPQAETHVLTLSCTQHCFIPSVTFFDYPVRRSRSDSMRRLLHRPKKLDRPSTDGAQTSLASSAASTQPHKKVFRIGLKALVSPPDATTEYVLISPVY